MPDSPHVTAIARWGWMMLGTLGALLSVRLVYRCLASGRALGPWRAGQILGDTYSASTHPAQFWCAVLMLSLLGAGFAFIAWRAWRS